jgi:hypothetical protein
MRVFYFNFTVIASAKREAIFFWQGLLHRKKKERGSQ